MNAILSIDLVDGTALMILGVLCAALVVYLVLRSRTRRWFIRAAAATLVGVIVGCVVLLIATATDLLDAPVEGETWLWLPAGCACIALAVVNLWRSGWWRRLVAVAALPVFALTTFLGVNAVYGIGRTPADLLYLSYATPVALPALVSPDLPASAAPLYQRWDAPQGMRGDGEMGVVPGGIPASVSSFPARPAQIYLPPAALTKDPPGLPLVIMMMGQPGSPHVDAIGAVLDEYQQDHDGLAPIALVVDQLGSPGNDPLCLNTVRGQVETYVMKDVVGWARTHLNIEQGRDAWTVAGYSNGGECAAYFGSKYPGTFGSILDVSGVEYAGKETEPTVLRDIFHGDQAAYDRVKPATIMAANAGGYPDTVAVFTMGEDDAEFRADNERLIPIAEAAGMRVSQRVIPGAGHGLEALNGGLEFGVGVLYPRWGLGAG